VTTLIYLGVENITMDLKAIVEESVNWIYLVQDTEQLQVLANTVTNLWVPYNLRNFLPFEGLLPCQELCSVFHYTKSFTF